jgi:hypothetical protein
VPRGVDRDAEFAAESGVHELLGRLFGKDPRQRLHGAQVLQLGQVAEVAAGQLLQSKTLPAAREAWIAFQERFGKPAVLAQGVPVCVIDVRRRPQ